MGSPLTKTPLPPGKTTVKEGACNWQTGTSCKTFNYTFDGAIQKEVLGSIPASLVYRADPYMFHQANFKLFPYKGSQRSMLGVWAEKYVHFSAFYLSCLAFLLLDISLACFALATTHSCFVLLP